MSDSLYNEIVRDCSLCNGTGEINGDTCECKHKLAAYSRILEGGFYRPVLDFVTKPEFVHPMYISGSQYVGYYVNNPLEVVKKGLSFYIYSRERGRGKTTLAHLLVYHLAYFFGPRQGNYRRNQTYGFETVNDVINNFLSKDEGLSKSTIYVLDDLGNEDQVQWKRDALISALQKIFQYRRPLKLPTIITSNYFPGDLSNRYGGILDSLLEIKPDGAIGGDLFRQIELGGGEDLRLSGDSSWPM